MSLKKHKETLEITAAVVGILTPIVGVIVYLMQPDRTPAPVAPAAPAQATVASGTPPRIPTPPRAGDPTGTTAPMGVKTPLGIPLLADRSLREWTASPGFSKSNWTFEGDALKGSGRTSHLFHSRTVRDFELTFETKISYFGNSGVYFRSRDTVGSPFPEGYEMQILGGGIVAPRKTGSLYNLVDIDRTIVDGDEWFPVTITARGNRIVIDVDGQRTVDYTDPKARHTSGRIALQLHDSETRVWFRNMFLKEL